jgi:putative DNA primase/helicase
MKQAGRNPMAGQLVRMVDLPAVPDNSEYGVFENVHDAPGDTSQERGGAFADAITVAGVAHHGHAGPAFIEKLTAQDDAVAQIRGYVDLFVQTYVPADASEQVRRVAKRFAVTAAAGELATKYGVTGWPSGEASKGVARCLQSWIDYRGTAGPAETTALVSQVEAWLAANIGRFDSQTRTHDERQKPPANRAGWIADEGTGRVYFVFGELFRNEVIKGFDPRMATRALVDAGMLQRGSQSRVTKLCRFDGERHWVYRLQLDQSGGGNDD